MTEQNPFEQPQVAPPPPPEPPSNLVPCPECGHRVARTATACPSCGSAFVQQKSAGVACLLSILIPGLGQLYQGRLVAGLLLFILTATTVWFLVGFLFWFIAIIDPLTYKPKSRLK